MTVENEELSQIVRMYFHHLHERGVKFRPGAIDSIYNAGLKVWGTGESLVVNAISDEAKNFMIPTKLKMPWGKLVRINTANSGARA